LALKRLAVPAVDGFPTMRHGDIAHRTAKRLSPVAQAFKAFVLEPAHQGPEGGL